MSGIFAAIVSGLGKAALAVISKITTQVLFERLLTQLTVHGLQKLADMTTNKLDDELVAEVVKQLEKPDK